MRADLRRIAVLLALAMWAQAALAEFTPNLSLSYEEDDSTRGTRTLLRQELELVLLRQVSDALQYRISLGANHYDSQASDSDALDAFETSAMELRPGASFTLNLPRYSWLLDYTGRRTELQQAGIDSTNSSDNFASRFGWFESRYLPGITLEAYAYNYGDSRSSADIGTQSASLSLNKSWNGFSAGVLQGYRIEGDSRSGYERTTSDSIANLSYLDSYLGGKLNVTASAGGVLTQIGDDARRTVTRIPNFIPVARAFWGIDETPLDSTDRPPTSIPSLIDTRLNLSTGISLGPEGQSFQNFVFDLGRVAEVDQVQILVRDERGDEITNPAGITWDVYTSIDGILWTRHDQDAQTTFDRFRSEFDISFRTVNTRWVKVVNFGVLGERAFVTEGLVLFHTTLGNASRDTEYTTITGFGNVSYAPVPTVSLYYNGAIYASDQTIGNVEQDGIDDSTHSVGARYDPRGAMSYDVSYEMHDASSAGFTEQSNSIRGGVGFQPRQQFQMTLFCDRREETFRDSLGENVTCSAQAAARIFPTVDITVGASQVQQDRQSTIPEAPVLSLTSDSTSAYVALTSRLTRTLRWNVNANANRTETESDLLKRQGEDVRVYSDLDWVPGQALGLGVTVGWIDADDFTGVIQRYRVTWNPFADGAISLVANYYEDFDPYTGSRSKRFLLSPRWQINRRLAFDITYSSVTTTGPNPLESQTLLAMLTTR